MYFNEPNAVQVLQIPSESAPWAGLKSSLMNIFPAFPHEMLHNSEMRAATSE
jgi:hypothetical protein